MQDSFLTRLLQRIDRKRDEYALEALKKPQARDLFEYGLRCGIIQGIEMSKAEILSAVNDDEEASNSL